MRYAEILFQQKILTDKDTLTYEIPEDLKVEIGQLVNVPLRKASKTGLIWELHNKKPEFKTLAISEIAKAEPLLSENQRTLAKWISRYYFCPLNKTIKLFIPKRVFADKKLTKEHEQKNRTKLEADKEKDLTPDQKEALDKILKFSSNKFLIHGVTGSGKTEIYVQLAKEFIKKGKQVLILIPEISLTPQTVHYFEKALGIEAAVINSKLSEGERQKHWMNIFENKTKLVIGSRSSIFSPFKDLGIIIMDEEHEGSYKQDQAPRYSTHRIIEKLLELNPSLKVVFGSATPSIETYHALKDNVIILENRIGNSVFPEIKIIDLRDEFQKHNYSIFSEDLASELKKILEEHDQAILFLNRRGEASSVICRDCGFVVKCDTCELSMTYHSKTLGRPSMICHHCGKIASPPVVCPNCKGAHIKFLGIGTQRIEMDTAKEFPKARSLRADRDTTATKHGFKEIYDKFKKREADLLIGTQMIAKGLDIPNVNLVGVILADIGLNIPDFRSTERNFQLMTQVAGRAGRREKKGKVIIQTYNPENIALRFCQEQDYRKFFEYEITQRKLLNNPPFSRFGKITCQHPKFLESKKLAETIENKLLKIAAEKGLTENIEITSYPAYIPRFRGRFRHIVLIKDKTANSLLHKLLENLPKEDIINQNLKIDIDPLSIT